MPVSLAVLDLAGTTVTDAGIVEDAFAHALARMGVTPDDPRHAPMTEHISATMGESKISVFRHLFDGEEAAQRANEAFEEGYAQMVAAGRCAALPGARQAIETLRGAGCAVVLNTGFSPRTRDDLLASLGWNGLADAVLSPADAGGRGRPYPDMVLTAMLRVGAPSVASVAVVGDTPHDIRAGLNAGAGLVAGVLTGGRGAGELREAGAHHVLDSVADLPALVGR
ncbi:phosphonatase-like hydrolase [Streptomyces iconiensis]|uniref:Phosphonatase-like hydrolase n=1 Tax=Streptomyces iconiensis TaxID=1384038 RepID=A0ABT7A0R9_9ACTN|nr:phosphonatase-like hydrolase [Streptomyces iconiensis]MDJ1134928.1 phosphonatase-like hydrolase [Streptomyces iconiensis]